MIEERPDFWWRVQEEINREFEILMRSARTSAQLQDDFLQRHGNKAAAHLVNGNRQ